MRKIISVLAIATLLLPLVASAQAMPDTCHLNRDLTDIDAACTDDTDVSIEDYGMCCLVNIIYSITDWIFYILMAFVGVMIIIGTFYIITAAGNPERVQNGRNYILYAVVGMIVAFFARAIPVIVKVLVGM